MQESGLGPEAGAAKAALVFKTTVIEPPRLSRRCGARIVLLSEAFQRTGSFKFRAAYHVACNVSQSLLITASSGNFGQALALACLLRNKRCIVVMPANSARVKIEGVRESGGQVELVDVAVKSRAERLGELAREHPEAYVASAYDDPLVIEGNASLGREVAAMGIPFDCIVAPVGGGGLASGVISGLRQAGAQIAVLGAEPLLANDAARSLAAGRILRNESEPQTIADGARTPSLGRHNWEILRQGLERIVEVPEAGIVEGVRLLFDLANLKAEPTGALALGAILTEPERFQGKCVGCIVSGGNVDRELFARMLSGRFAE
jgi:threonine dehydratase